MKTLFAGPYTGEFGWEVMGWQAHIRALSAAYDRVVVASQPGHEGMYEFASKFVPIETDTIKANMWQNAAEDNDAFALFRIRAGTEADIASGSWITPNKVWEANRRGRKEQFVTALHPQKFITFGKKGNAEGYDILYHARLRDDWDSGFRNWTAEHCANVLLPFKHLKVAAIGKFNRALHIPGTDDKRNVSLSELADLMANSKCLVGPISGPVHFGVLTGIPQVTWATKQEHRERTTRKWNPLNSPIECFCADDSVWRDRVPWNPPVDDVVSVMRTIL